jgi:hypothetical protein
MSKNTPTQIARFPRLARNVEERLKSEQAALETDAREVIADFPKLRVRLGRIFRRLKVIARNFGYWGTYYHETFGTSGVSFRTAERYMALAEKADANSENDSLTILKPGNGPAAQEIQAATTEAQTEVGVAPKPEAAYRLALGLSPFRRAATIRLWASPRRRRAERNVIACLDAILVEAGLLTADELTREAADQNGKKA